MNIIAELEAAEVERISAQRTIPEFSPGDTVRVNVRVTEGTRTRVQAFEGVCIARSGRGLQENFTVRKISYGEGVERVGHEYLEVEQHCVGGQRHVADAGADAGKDGERPHQAEAADEDVPVEAHHFPDAPGIQDQRPPPASADGS